jgi:hypothetical protein
MPSVTGRAQHKEIVTFGSDFDTKLQGLHGAILADHILDRLEIFGGPKGKILQGASVGKLIGFERCNATHVV